MNKTRLEELNAALGESIIKQDESKKCFDDLQWKIDILERKIAAELSEQIIKATKTKWILDFQVENSYSTTSYILTTSADNILELKDIEWLRWLNIKISPELSIQLQHGKVILSVYRDPEFEIITKYNISIDKDVLKETLKLERESIDRIENILLSK